MSSKVIITDTKNTVTITPTGNTNVDTNIVNTPVTVTQDSVNRIEVLNKFTSGASITTTNITASGDISASGNITVGNIGLGKLNPSIIEIEHDHNSSNLAGIAFVNGPNPPHNDIGFIRHRETGDNGQMEFATSDNGNGYGHDHFIFGASAGGTNIINMAIRPWFKIQGDYLNRPTAIISGTLELITGYSGTPGNIKVSGDVAATNITASGNISASGNIFATSMSLGHVTNPLGQLHIADNGTEVGSNRFVVKIPDNSIQLGTQGGFFTDLKFSNNGGIAVTDTGNTDYTSFRVNLNRLETNKIRSGNYINNLQYSALDFESSLFGITTVDPAFTFKTFTNAGSLNRSRLEMYNGDSGAVILQPSHSSGNVGIGTNSTPGEKLTVSGSISASGDVYAQNIRIPIDAASPGKIIGNDNKSFQLEDGGGFARIDVFRGFKVVTNEGTTSQKARFGLDKVEITNADFSVDGHITASGDISASGDITANQMLLQNHGSVILTLNSTQNGQSSRINLREDGNQFGAYMMYDSSDFHIGSIDSGADTDSIIIAREGDVTFNHNVQIGNQKTLTVLLDNDRTTPSFTVQDENTSDSVFSISGGGSGNPIANLLLTGSVNIVPSASVGGNITASGNISASGDISGSSLHIKGSGRNEIRGNDGFRLVGGWSVGAEDLRYLDLDGTTLQYRTNGDAKFEIRSQNVTPNDTFIHFNHASPPGPQHVSIGTCQDSGSFIIARDEGFAENNDFTITGSNGFIGINEPNPTHQLSVNGTVGITGTTNITGEVSMGPQGSAGPITGYTLSIRDTSPNIALKNQTSDFGIGGIKFDATSTVSNLILNPTTGSANANTPPTVTIKLEDQEAAKFTTSSLILDYDKMPTADPGVKGTIYRSSSAGINNLLFISPGS